MAANLTLSCPTPFLNEADYSETGGCKYPPHPITHNPNAYSPSSNRHRRPFLRPRHLHPFLLPPLPARAMGLLGLFPRQSPHRLLVQRPRARVPGFSAGHVCGFGAEKSHRHYLSVGLCVALVLLEVSLLICCEEGRQGREVWC